MVEDLETEVATETGNSCTYGFIRLILTICGISEVKVESQIDIPVEKRKVFLTETSERVRALNKALAIVLIAVISFLIGYFK